MKRMAGIAAGFLAAVFFVTGIPAITVLAEEGIPAAEQAAAETMPADETVAVEEEIPEEAVPEAVIPEEAVLEEAGPEAVSGSAAEEAASEAGEHADMEAAAEGQALEEDPAAKEESFLKEAAGESLQNLAPLSAAVPSEEAAQDVPSRDVPEEPPFDNSTTVKDDTYPAEAENVTFTKPTGKTTFTLVKVTVQNGRATAVMKTSSSKMTHVYVGSRPDLSAEEADLTDAGGNLIPNVYKIENQTFEIPVKLNAEGCSFQTRTTAMSVPKWTNNAYKITITEPAGETAADYGKVEAARAKVPADLSKYTEESVAVLNAALAEVTEGKPASEQALVDSWAKAIEQAVAGLQEKAEPGEAVAFEDLTDGAYRAEVSCSSSMFPVAQACAVELKNGVFSVTIKMKSADNISQDKVYLGKAKDAANDSAGWIAYVPDSNGVYTFMLRNVPIGEFFDLASYSVNREKWYDRQLIVDKDSFTRIADDHPDPEDGPDSGPGGGTAPSAFAVPVNDGKAEQESGHTGDLNRSTAAVDNATGLADGVYTPDKFSFSGGSGRASFTCTKVTVTGGNAYATLVFNSGNFQYVKANGNIYYCAHSGNTSTVTIPVALNVNNTIIGMTTAMSQPHEITYIIFVYIAGADAQQGGSLSDHEKLDTEAPVIAGLEFIDEERTENAELFKIFNYSDGIRLLEIDMTRKETGAEEADGRSGAETKEEDAKPLPDDETIPAEDESTEGAAATKAEVQTELYKGNVIKYLLVPENAEIPAGLEKETVVIRLPLESVYSGSEDISDILENFGLEDLITSQPKENPDHADVPAAGAYPDIDLKVLIKSKCSLALLPEDCIQDQEGKEAFEVFAGDLANLEIPVLVDRAAYEKTDQAKAEWLKVYGVLFGCEKEAQEAYEALSK